MIYARAGSSGKPFGGKGLKVIWEMQKKSTALKEGNVGFSRLGGINHVYYIWCGSRNTCRTTCRSVSLSNHWSRLTTFFIVWVLLLCLLFITKSCIPKKTFSFIYDFLICLGDQKRFLLRYS